MEISVIVPALNEEKYIEDCLKSILNQTFPRKRYEIIVSDGASTDNTGKIAKRYADRVVVSKKRGIWWGRNYGAKFAKGKYLVFIDADTVLDKDYLETVYPYLEKGYVGVSTGFRLSGKGLKLRAYENVGGWWWWIASKINWISTIGFNVCIPKTIFNEIGGFKNVPAEDVIMDMELKKIGKNHFVKKRKVCVSSRRLKDYGLFGYCRYYIETELIGRGKIKNPKKMGWIKNKSYSPVR
ncbi:MAG: glycosyltransferase [Candidatus Aenigmatarchaeota archaeon]